MFSVVYKILESGVTVRKTFASPYLCRKFANKIKFSKKCQLISYSAVEG